ncbi:hypothetical protein FRC10_007120 [Ceratobasidium sp. 414]|nr:hypothetical protein FRC10_007120 [Ceratobasidium sp. 414]
MLSLYQLALLLHPSMHVHYLKAAKWEQEWIDTVAELAKEIWLPVPCHCDDNLKIVHNLLGAKSLAIHYKLKNLTGEQATTPAESLIKALQDKVENA